MTTTEPANARAAWLAARRECICASDIPALLGFYGSPVEVYLSKIEGREIEDNDAMMLGRNLEAGILQTYREKHPEYQVFPNIDTLRHHPNNPHHAATPDAIAWQLANGIRIYNDGLVQIKLSGQHIDEPTPAHITQVQWEMYVTGAAWCDLVHVCGTTYKEFRIERDDELIQSLIRVADEFYHDHMEPRIPPEPVKDGDAALLWPRSEEGKTVEATPELVTLVAALRVYKGDVAEIEVEVVKLQSQIQSILRDAESLTYNGEVIATWKTSADRVTINTEELIKCHPDIAAKFTITKPGSRRFLIKGEGNE